MAKATGFNPVTVGSNPACPTNKEDIMKTANGTIILDEDIRGFSPVEDGVIFTEETGVKFFVRYSLLVRLYEGSKYSLEKRGVKWDDFCKKLFEENNN